MPHYDLHQQREFNKANICCQEVMREEPAVVKEFAVYDRKSPWASISSPMVRKTHRYLAILRLELDGQTLTFAVSNNSQPAIAALDTIKLAIAGRSPVTDGGTGRGEPFDYATICRSHCKELNRIKDSYVEKNSN